MRAISQFGEFGIQIRPQRSKGMGDGSIQITQEPIYAKFKPYGEEPAFDSELEKASRVFSFKGRFQHVDEATPVDASYRISVLDTTKQGWDDETRAIVEAELRRKEKITNDFFISDEKQISPPFPTWDTSTKPAYALVASAVEMGFDLKLALDYERLFGQDRPDVVEALEACIADDERIVEETISA